MGIQFGKTRKIAVKLASDTATPSEQDMVDEEEGGF